MFYDKFIELCEKQGIKPTPLVKNMGLSSSNVSAWKHGGTPRPEVLKKFAEYFGVSVSYLLDIEEIEKPSPAPQIIGSFDKMMMWCKGRTMPPQKIAEFIGLDTDYFSNLENGEIPGELLPKIADILQIPVDYLIKEKTPVPKSEDERIIGEITKLLSRLNQTELQQILSYTRFLAESHE